MKKMTEAELSKAKQLYMDYVSITEIASILGRPKETIQYHVTKKWKSERVLRANETLADLSDSKIAQMSNTFSDSFRSIAKWVAFKSSDPKQLTPHEVKTMMSIVTEMDKITRLDAGSPTDIIADTKPIDVIEVRKRIIKADPFIDYKEIENEETTEIHSEGETKDPEDSATS